MAVFLPCHKHISRNKPFVYFLYTAGNTLIKTPFSFILNYNAKRNPKLASL